MKEKIKDLVRERLLKVAKEAYDDNPMKGSPFEGMMVQSAIADASQSYKQKFIEERFSLGLSEEDFIEIVDDATTEIVNKLFN